MNIFLSGASGFIGQALTQTLIQNGHSVTGVSRNANRAGTASLRWVGWDSLEKEIPQHEVVIHLAGENVFGGLWTESAKKRILDSRIVSTRKIASIIQQNPGNVKTLVSTSAVGIYGDAGTDWLTEKSPEGTGFLADVCKQWEAEAQAANKTVLVSIPRIGVVLEKDGGALAKMIPQFQLFLGGPAGGDQFVPWIHRNDLIRAFLFAIEKPISGVWNATASNPVTMSELSDELGEALHRPSFFKAPAFALKLALGEASSAILASARAKPERLLNEGFSFHFPEVKDALTAIVKNL